MNVSVWECERDDGKQAEFNLFTLKCNHCGNDATITAYREYDDKRDERVSLLVHCGWCAAMEALNIGGDYSCHPAPPDEQDNQIGG